MNTVIREIRLVINNLGKTHKLQIHSAVDLAHTIYGPPLSRNTPFIILHGLLGSKSNWRTVSKQLSETLNKTVIAADIRNHGESPHSVSHTYRDLAQDVEHLMNKLNIRKADLIGHSMGGRTAMVLALTKPYRVDNLIIVDISPISSAGALNDFFPRIFDAMKSVKFDGVPNVSEARQKARKALAATGIDEKAESLSFIVLNAGKTINKSLGWQCNIDALKNNINEIMSFPQDLVATKKFNGRTLFIGGEYSNHLPPEDIHKIMEVFPKAEVHYMKAVGHNPHAEDTATFVTIIADFIKGNP